MICPALIRPGMPADLPAMRAAEISAAALFAGTHMAFAVDQPPTAPADLRAAIDRQLLWVAEIDAAAVGFVFAEPGAGGLYIRELSVATAFQQRGIGAALMRTAIAAARARGDALAILTTDRTLAWNAPFYARLGFRIVEGDAMPLEARQRLAGQIAAGFDPAQRCAMVLALA